MLFVLSMGAVACVPDEPDLEGRPCPCVTGFTCVDLVCRRDVDGSTPVEMDAHIADAAAQDSRPSADVGQDAMSPTDVGPRDAMTNPDVPPTPDVGPGADAGPDARPPRDAGTDAGPTPVDAGPRPSFCERHGAGSYLCLDFDTDFPAGWTRVESNGGQARFDTTRSVSGRSLRVSGAAVSNARYERNNIGNVSSGTIWVRMRVFVESGGTNNPYFPLLSLSQRLTEPYEYFALSLSNSGRIRTLLSRGALGSMDGLSDENSYPAGRWLCLESQFDASSSSTPVVTYLDGVEVSRFTTPTEGTYDRIHVGADETGAGQVQRTLWLDDVVWSSSRVRCNLE